MSYRVTRGADGRPRLQLNDEPAYCRALDAAPSAREPELDSGLWLILVFATWSVPDVNAIQTALDAARHFAGEFNLGLRPYDDPEEHAAWCLEIAGDMGSPLWLLLRDGRVCMKRTGLLTLEELIAAIESNRSCGSADDERR